jgi:hypothetical protein
MNANWPRWIHASIAVAMKDVASDLSLSCLVEGIDERTAEFVHSKAHVEVRITGPLITNPSSGYYRATMDVNILLSQRDEDVANAYDLLKWAGAFMEALSDPIPVWNYGNEADDYVEGDESTQVFLGCLSSPSKQKARLLNFGQITVTDAVNQIEVENAFEIELTD